MTTRPAPAWQRPPPGPAELVERRKAELRAARSAVEAAERKAGADLERSGRHGDNARAATTAKARKAAQERASAAIRTYREGLQRVAELKRAEQKALGDLADAHLAHAGDLTRRAEKAQRFAFRFAASVRHRSTETTGERPDL